MASNYGPHFGVRRWDEDVAIREGRYKTPTTGNKLLIGSAVEIDFASAGGAFMKQGANGATLKPGVSGLLIWEDQFLQRGPIGSIDSSARVDTAYLAYASLGKYAVIAGGAGSKFWFKDNPERTTLDGNVIPAIAPVAGLVEGGGGTVALGDYLGWNGTQWYTTEVAANPQPADAWFQVVSLNDDAGLLEATLLK